MNSEERQAAIDALKDILRSRKEEETLPTGASLAIDDGKLKIDPNLIYPAPKFPGKASENLNINDPKGLLSKLKQNKPNNNKNQGRDAESDMAGNEQESDNKGSDSSDGKEKAENSTSSGNQSGEQSDKNGDSDEKTSKSSSANNANDDYADAWNAIMSKYDLDSISERDLQDLLQQIQQGKIQSI